VRSDGALNPLFGVPPLDGNNPNMHLFRAIEAGEEGSCLDPFLQ
jgi:hypothetical protein